MYKYIALCSTQSRRAKEPDNSIRVYADNLDDLAQRVYEKLGDAKIVELGLYESMSITATLMGKIGALLDKEGEK